MNKLEKLNRKLNKLSKWYIILIYIAILLLSFSFGYFL